MQVAGGGGMMNAQKGFHDFPLSVVMVIGEYATPPRRRRRLGSCPRCKDGYVRVLYFPFHARRGRGQGGGGRSGGWVDAQLADARQHCCCCRHKH